jgi:hypothetical protein
MKQRRFAQPMAIVPGAKSTARPHPDPAEAATGRMVHPLDKKNRPVYWDMPKPVEYALHFANAAAKVRVANGEKLEGNNIKKVPVYRGANKSIVNHVLRQRAYQAKLKRWRQAKQNNLELAQKEAA